MASSVGGALLGGCVLFCLLILRAYVHSRIGGGASDTVSFNGRRILASGVLAPAAPREQETAERFHPLPPETTGDKAVYPCIHCARCLDVCPVSLNPCRLVLLARKKRYTEMAEKYGLDACVQCGACAEVCPSNIPLLDFYCVAWDELGEKGLRDDQ